MTRRCLAPVLIVVLLIPATLLVGAGSASAAPPKWTVEASPDGGTLGSLSCVGTTRCFAVGGERRGLGANPHMRSLIDTWHEGAWAHTASPYIAGPDILRSVSCSAARFCVAVGDYTRPTGSRSLIEMYDGTRWSIVDNPNTGHAAGKLTGVSCASKTFCVAVGNTKGGTFGHPTHPIVKTWDGHQWAFTPSPDLSVFGVQNELATVSCPTARFCVAAGRTDSGFPWIETWDGVRWSPSPAPKVPYDTQVFAGVSCASATFCVAVGVSQGTEPTLWYPTIDTWDGTAWSRPRFTAWPPISAFGDEGEFSGVSCATPTSCVAVGGGSSYSVDLDRNIRPTIERWNGSTWSLERGPANWSKGQRWLHAVSCTTDACAAVGDSPLPGVPLIVRGTPR